MTKKNGQPWRNRIVGYSEEAPEQLLANPSNWRIHPQYQQAALSGVLKDVGVVQNVIANKSTGTLVDGHLRVMLAMREGQPTLPVTWVDLTDEEEALILATLDPIAALAAADKDKLDELLHSVQTDDAAVQNMLAQLAAKSGLYDPVDVDELWQGMPEFEQEDGSVFRTIKVHFANQDDVDDFARLIGQKITERTKFVWYPELVELDMINYQVGGAADDES